MNRFLFILVLGCSFLYSCHSARKVTGTTPTVTTDTVLSVNTPPHATGEDSAAFIRSVVRDIQSHRIEFTTFSGKIDLDYEDGNGNKYNVNAHVRMYKDSVIWISVTAILGIEGLRVYITPDSVKVLDKQNKSYKARSIAFLSDMTALPLDLPTLQDILLGNPVFLDSAVDEYTRSGNTVTLVSRGDLFTNLFTVTETDKLPQRSQLQDSDPEKKRSCILTYGDYENKKDQRFAQDRTILIEDKTKLNLKMDYKQYDFNEKLSFPFSVPKNYDSN